ncbi:xylose isomerase [Methanomicrobiaceae archaeon CYW5]|uniref:sugar phosphate isomerase/epimerase family protein n=1 Tax=Methanovulcanius yangii TaxID=1789227 RepID=UPI0029CA1701|nr:sugar phosphate isomerase/epimerase family protein [Methanovulcanius yangii]MBT8507137.1 xylose isomerase [Methanovulcanius yangii]
MVRIGCSSMFFHEYQVREIFSFLEQAGCSAIEFWVETPYFWLSGLPIQELRESIDAHPCLLPIAIHAPVLDLNPCSINPGIVEVSIGYTCNAGEIAALTNASLLTIHPGRRTAKRPPSEMDYRRLEYYLDAVHACMKDTTVPVAIENMEPKINALLCSPEQMAEVLENHPWLSFTLDTAHAETGNADDLEDYINWFFDRIANVHVSAVGAGGPHMRVHGDQLTGHAIALLADYGYEGPLILELEDLHFSRHLSGEEKVTILEEEVAFLESFFD